MGNIVSLVRVRNPNAMKDSVSEATRLINFEFPKKIETVAIKPNLCYYWTASTGYTTDRCLVAGIIDVLRENCGDDLDIRVAEADATAMRTKYAFQMLGYTKLAEEKKVELLNLSKDVLEDRTVKVNGIELTFKVPRTLLDADLFINVPKLKIMREVVVSCALKNLFGCIGSPRKIAYHPHLNEAIVGISQVLKPHLTIVDGMVALGKFPARLDLVMAGKDPFSVDWTAAQIAGHNPSRIRFLSIARKEKLGNPKDVSVMGESIDTFKKMFPRNNFFPQELWWSIEVRLLNLYNKIVGDIVPPILEE